MELTNTERGIPRGYPSLDKTTGGWQNSNLIVIASRPSVGKTTFALNIARNAAVDHNIPVAFFSLEMSSAQLSRRLIIQETGLSKEDGFGNRDIDAAQWQQLEGRLEKLSKAPLYVDDTPGLSVKDFHEKAKQLVDEQGVKLILVDYLQLMQGPEEFRGQREQEVAYIARALKSIAKELNVPITALSQLSRTLNTKPGRPELKDIRESSSIEETADLVILIHRPGIVGICADPSDREKAEFIIAKNLNGYLDKVPMLFKVEQLQFEETDISFKQEDNTAEPLGKNQINTRLNPLFSFNNFTVAECNVEAVQAAKDITHVTEGSLNYTLMLVGEYGSGKTHLVNALGNAAKKMHPEITVLYVSADDFKYQYMDAVKSNRLSDFKAFYDKVDLLILDNLQDLLGPGTQNIFFHIMDGMQQKGKRLVITSTRNLDELKDTVEDRLLEHISWGKIVEIKKYLK